MRWACFLGFQGGYVKVADATRNRLSLFMFTGARYVCRRRREEQPAPLWVRGMGDPAPVPLYPQHPLTPFPRWGPAGPPSPDLGGGGLRPSPRLGLYFHRCAFPQQKVTMIIVPVDGDHGVGSSHHRTTFSLSRWYVSFFPQPSGDHPFPAAKNRQAQTGDVAECRQIPKPVFGAGKRTPAVTSSNHSQHHVIVRGRSETRAKEGICRNERVALVFASFSLKKKKKSFPVSYCTKRQLKSQRTQKASSLLAHLSPKTYFLPPASSRKPSPHPTINNTSYLVQQSKSVLYSSPKRRDAPCNTTACA